MVQRKNIDELALRAFTQSTKKGSDNMSITQLLTKKERIIIGRRILIAQAILAGKTRYEIQNHMKISPNTFTQVKQWLESEFLDYVPSTKTATPSSCMKNKPKITRVEPFSYEAIKRKYPAHFLLFSLVEELFSIKK